MAKTATLKARTSDSRKSKRGGPTRRELAEIRRKEDEAYEARSAGTSAHTIMLMDEMGNLPAEMPAITTAADVMRALGGVSAVQRWLLTSESSLGRWAVDGCVPGGHRLPVYLALRDLGYTKINPELFDMDSWEDSRLPHMRRPALAA